jgi:hypothetical protein
MHKGIKNFIYHAEVVVTFALLLHIHEIFIHGVETGGQQLCDAKARFR